MVLIPAQSSEGHPNVTDRTYTSPDGLLRFTVTSAGEDVILGFDGYPWHTHADLLAAFYGLPDEAAVDRFVGALLDSETVIAILRRDGNISDISVTHDPQADCKYVSANETVEFRYWDGTPWQPEAIAKPRLF